MDGAELIQTLKRITGTTTDLALAQQLGVTQPAVSGWRNSRSLTVRQVSGLMKKMWERSVVGDELIEQVKRKLRADSYKQLAQMLGITQVNLHTWRGRKALTTRQIANLVHAAKESATDEAHASAIRPIVEFLPIQRGEGAGRQHFLQVDRRRGQAHPYQEGLRRELESSHGVYIFFDSRGRALYAGKAKLKNLYSEMISAFNRNRDVQNIWRVKHPERRVAYRRAEDKSRQIRRQSVKLHHLAAYVSAYEVSEGLIDELESLLIRSFPNDLMNTRMEKFRVQRRPKARKTKKAKKHR
jgi:DNA-binding transcriptional regulator YdaS (Cro superfamily)